MWTPPTLEQYINDQKLIRAQATIIIHLVDMILKNIPDLSEDEKKSLSFMKSGSYAALGEDQS